MLDVFKFQSLNYIGQDLKTAVHCSENGGKEERNWGWNSRARARLYILFGGVFVFVRSSRHNATGASQKRRFFSNHHHRPCSDLSSIYVTGIVFRILEETPRTLRTVWQPEDPNQCQVEAAS